MIETAIARCGGVARRAELLTMTGMNPRALDREVARLVDSGTIRRPRRGIVALHDAPRARVVARSVGGAVTCVSAAHEWGLPLLAVPSSAHVAVPTSTSGRITSLVPAGTVLHWDSTARPGAGRPDPVGMFRHLVSCLPLREVVAVADAALRRGLVRREQLEATRPRSSWSDHERLVRAMDPGAQSIAESFARVALTSAGLRVQTQVYFPGVGQVDMLVEGVVVVEIDGFAYHSGRQEFREDRRRDRELLLEHGLPVLRFGFEDSVHQTAQLVEDVRAAVARRR